MTETLVNFLQKIVLGTAQFGMDYGIANVSGQPTKSEVFKILEMAWHHGIRIFDTAPGYESEVLLGEFITVHGLEKDAILLTKISGIEEKKDKQTAIKNNIEASLEKLGCNIEVLFFHNPKDSELILKDPFFFNKLLEDYPLKKLGVSVYDPSEVEILKDCELELAFQFPFNVLDRRFEKVNMPQGRRYARSIFLQGILASPNRLRNDAPRQLSEMQKKYFKIINAYKLDPKELAISYVAKSEHTDYFLVGLDSQEQLHEIITSSIDLNLSLKNFDLLLSTIDKKWMDPRSWN